MELPKFLLLSGHPGRRAGVVSLRDAVAPVLASNYFSHFTDHSVSHSDQLCGLADGLAVALPSEKGLTGVEAQILYFACYLHDIGLHNERAGETAAVRRYMEQASPYNGMRFEDLERPTKQLVVRDMHHKISAEMVQSARNNGSPAIGFTLTDSDEPGIVAALCAAHCMDPKSQEYKEAVADNANIRVGLLSALLRMADILDESRRRSHIELELTRDLPVESRYHWWRHYYVSDVKVNATQGTITLFIDFPPEMRESYADLFDHVGPIAVEHARHAQVFANNHVAWHIAAQETPPTQCAARPMPPEVERHARGAAAQRHAQRLRDERVAVVGRLRAERPDIVAKFADLRSFTGPADQRMERAVGLADHLWKLGGHRDAWSILWNEFSQNAAKLENGQRLNVALRLAEMMVADDAAEVAIHVLNPLVAFFAALAEGNQLRRQFLQLWAETLRDVAAYPDAVAAFAAINGGSVDHAAGVVAAAEVAEIQLMWGDVSLVNNFDYRPSGDEKSGGSRLPARATLIENATGECRQLLAVARRRGMQSGCDAALSSLEKAVPVQPKDAASKVAIDLLRSELLYLDDRLKLAGSEFDDMVAPSLESIEPEIAVRVMDNRTVVGMAAFDPAAGGSRFYHEVDMRRVLGVELRDSDNALGAAHHASVGEHHKALSILRSQLLRAYRSQSWRARAWAHADLCREFLALGWYDDAAWHAVQSLEAPLVKAAAKSLIDLRDARRTEHGVLRLLAYSKLARHADLTAQFFAEVADYIPDDLVRPATEWVGPMLAQPSGYRAFKSAWTLAGRLAERLDPTTALGFIEVAVAHPTWKDNRGHKRAHLIDACHRLIPRVGAGELKPIVQPAIDLVTAARSDVDYVAAVNLICQIVERGSGYRDPIREAIMPSGVEIRNAILLQAAPALGWIAKHPEGLDANVEGVALALRGQVQVIADGEALPAARGMMQVTQQLAGQKVIVDAGAGEDHLRALITHRALLSPQSVGLLVQAILDVFLDDRNLIMSRVSLAVALGDLASVVVGEQANAVLSALARVARGEFRESPLVPSYADATNPLSTMKINTGDPRELRRAALLAMAEGSASHTTWARALHGGLFQMYMEAPDQHLRCTAIEAALIRDDLSDAEVWALTLASLDPEPKVRAGAIRVIAKLPSRSMDERTLSVLLMSLKNGARSPDRTERFWAAKAARSVFACLAVEDRRRGDLNGILGALRGDASFHVRRAANGEAD